MRTATLALTSALLFGLLPAQPTAGQATPPDPGPGRIVWFDLTTTDLAKAQDFYGKLFNWEFAPVPGSNDTTVLINVEGTGIGTIRVAHGPISGFNGVVYVQVTDLPASCDKLKTLGGTVVPGFPFNLPGGAGAVGLAIDPTGHPIGLYSRTPLPEPPAPAAGG
jgi:predicted enzyme related to lactoylglutathione lyase